MVDILTAEGVTAHHTFISYTNGVKYMYDEYTYINTKMYRLCTVNYLTFTCIHEDHYSPELHVDCDGGRM